MKSGSKKQVVFVGGGHVHLLSLKNADQFIRAGAEVTLVGPDRFHYYSGMGPGMLSRIYKPEQVRFDVQSMVESRGGRFVKDKVISLDPANRTLALEGGEEIPYDLVSFNIGSYVPMDHIPGAESGIQNNEIGIIGKLGVIAKYQLAKAPPLVCAYNKLVCICPVTKTRQFGWVTVEIDANIVIIAGHFPCPDLKYVVFQHCVNSTGSVKD